MLTEVFGGGRAYGIQSQVVLVLSGDNHFCLFFLFVFISLFSDHLEFVLDVLY